MPVSARMFTRFAALLCRRACVLVAVLVSVSCSRDTGPSDGALWQRDDLAPASRSELSWTGDVVGAARGATVVGVGLASGKDLWTATIRSAYLTLNAYQGLFVVSAFDSLNNEVRHMLDPRTGETLWSQPIPPFRALGTVGVANGIYIERDDSSFAGRDVRTGALKWSTQVPTGPCARPRRCFVFDGGTIVGGVAFVFATSDRGNGASLLRVTSDGVVTERPADFGTCRCELGASLDAGVIVRRLDPKLYGVDMQTGATRWTVDPSTITPPPPNGFYALAGAYLYPDGDSEVAGSEPVIYATLRTRAAPTTTRRILIRARDGHVIRYDDLPGSSPDDDLLGSRRCGIDGIVDVRRNGVITLTNVRTGVVVSRQNRTMRSILSSGALTYFFGTPTGQLIVRPPSVLDVRSYAFGCAP